MMKRWAIFFGLFMIAIIILADTGHLGKLGLIYDFPNGHWVGHFVLFGLLSFVANLAVFEERPSADRKRLAVITSLILIFFIGLEEFSQQYFPTRHSDWLDFTFSCLGVVSFALLAVAIKMRPSASR